MGVIVGMLIILGGVFGGFMLEGGNIMVIVRAIGNEGMIIVGAGIGSFLIANPGGIFKIVMSNFKKVFQPSTASKAGFTDLLSLLYMIFTKIRKDGLISVEEDVDDPSKSALFAKYKGLLSNHHLMSFITDNLKVIITTNMAPHELDNLLDIDLEAHHHETGLPSTSINTLGDSFPGLGIVAAVLGVVLTMGKMSEGPEVLGESIGAALVGTFLGILLCYGFVGPFAQNIGHKINDENVFYSIVKVALVSFVGGAAPQIAVESGRRAIPSSHRPSFGELEQALRK
ncbi:MAG: flagellar motor stator protein MotA [Nitrospirae bacterium]|nr:flagellar motor stator protein MotA [Nitrospirota bacterium]